MQVLKNCETHLVEYRVTIQTQLFKGGEPNFLAVVQKYPSVAVLREKKDTVDLILIMSAMLTRLTRAFNVSKNMNETQILDYATTLVLECAENPTGGPALTLADFAVFFEQCKLGRYGKPFDYVDAALIETWLDKYYQERNAKFRQQYEAAERERQDREWNAILRNPESKTVSSETVAGTVETILKGIEERKAETPAQREQREMEEALRTKRLAERQYEAHMERVDVYGRAYWGNDYDTVRQKLLLENKEALKKAKREYETVQNKKIQKPEHPRDEHSGHSG